MSALLNPKNITIARTAERPVARTAKPRMTTVKLRGTNASTIAANRGRQKMQVSMESVRSEGRKGASKTIGEQQPMKAKAAEDWPHSKTWRSQEAPGQPESVLECGQSSAAFARIVYGERGV